MSPALPKLTSNSTPLSHGPLTIHQISYIGAISCFGSIIGTLTFGYLTSWIGSKRVLSFLGYPQMVSWLLIYFGSAYCHILISRFLEGWAMGGLQVALLLYIAEIVNDEYALGVQCFSVERKFCILFTKSSLCYCVFSIRGQLGSICLFFRNLGKQNFFLYKNQKFT